MACRPGKLGTWVKNVRSSQKKGELSEEQKKRLSNVGFAWQGGKAGNPSTAETRLVELETFKSKYGHCNVPRKAGKLGTWVNNTRKRQKKLPEELKHVLDNMGFKWQA